MSVTFDITGDKQFGRFLDRFPKDIARKSDATGAMKKAAKLMVRAIRSAAPRKTGALKKSIGTVVSKRKSGPLGAIAVVVGPRVSKTLRGFTGLFLEHGTAERFTKRRGFLRLRKGKSTGRIRAKPFVGPSFSATVGQYQKILPIELTNRIIIRAKKVASEVGSNR